MAGFLDKSKSKNIKTVGVIFAVCLAAGASFGLLVRFSGKTTAMEFMGLKSQDVTKSFRKTLYRTAQTDVMDSGAEAPTRGARAEKMAYDSSFVLFGKPKDWEKGRKGAERQSGGEAERQSGEGNSPQSPIDFVKKERKSAVTSQAAATLDDMGVDTKLPGLEPLSPFDAGAGGNLHDSDPNAGDSTALVKAGGKLKRSRPVSLEKAGSQNTALAKRQTKSAGSVNTARGALRHLTLKPMEELRMAARMGQFAYQASDPDSAVTFSRAFATGENIKPALDMMFSRGEIGAVTGSEVTSAADAFWKALGLDSAGEKVSGGSGGGSAAGGAGSSDSDGQSSADAPPLSLDGLSLVLTDRHDSGQGSAGVSADVQGASASFGEQQVCPICQTISAPDPNLLIGPAPPQGPAAQVDEGVLSTTVSLQDLQVMSGGSSGQGLNAVNVPSSPNSPSPLK